VHDHVTEIDENPRSIGMSFDACDAVSVMAHGLDDRIGDSARLDLRAAADDREGIGQDRAPAYVEDREGFAFFVECALANDVYQLADVCTSNPKVRAASSVGGAADTPLRS